MESQERRSAPRKNFAVPLRFRTTSTANSLDIFEGEIQNVSEHGVFFTTARKMSIGDPLELFFTLPRELTGRSPEPVRCQARIVHVHPQVLNNGRTGIGATIDQFEAEPPSYKWGN
jgi:Tfp pilus assembly protein PilZ